MRRLLFALTLVVGLSACDTTTSDPATAGLRDFNEPDYCPGQISWSNKATGNHVRIRIDDLHPNAAYDSHDLQYRPPGGSWTSAMFPQNGYIQEGQIATFPYVWASSPGFSVEYRLVSYCFDTPNSPSYSQRYVSYPVVNQ